LEVRPVLPIPSWEVEEGEITEGEALSFTATFEVLPEVEAGVYEGLEVKRREPKVDEEQVEQFLERQQQELTQFIPVEGDPMAAGHIVHCDVMGKVGDEAVSMPQLVFALPEAGEEQEGIGLRDPQQAAVARALAPELRGAPAEPGERELEITFGDDAPEPWPGQTARLLVELQAVRERKVPELDDEFAKETGEADTLEEYKEQVRKKLLEADESRVKQEMRQQLESRLIEANPIEVTDTLVEKQLNSVMERARMAFQLRGISAEALGMDDASMRETFRDSAEKEVKKTLLTDAVGKAEQIEVTEEELEARLTELAEAQGESVARLRAEYEKGGNLEGLRVVMREEKVIDLLLDRAHVTTVSEAEYEAAKREDDEKSDENPEGTSDAAGGAEAGAEADVDAGDDGATDDASAAADDDNDQKKADQ
jgi:trigger factor